MPSPVLWMALLALSQSYHVVLKDGSRLEAERAPEVREEMARVLLVDGNLVSLPARRVDWPATDAANAPTEPAAAAAAAENETTPVRMPARRRPDVPATITNQTIAGFAAAKAPGEVPRTGAVAALTELGPEAAAPAGAVPVAPERLDKNGQDALSWRARARVLRDATRTATRALEASRQALADEEQALVSGRTVSLGDGSRVLQFARTREERAVARLRISELAEKVRDREAALAEARARELDLAEEARQAGADPGWLRVPVAYP